MRADIRRNLSAAVCFLARTFGAKIRDSATGMVLGRAFVFPWNGRIQIIGLNAQLYPLFSPQTRPTYWKQEIEFRAHLTPDFPSEKRR